MCLGRNMPRMIVAVMFACSLLFPAIVAQAAWETQTSNTVVANSGDYGFQWLVRNTLSGVRGGQNLALARAQDVYVDAAGNVYSTGYLDSGGNTLSNVLTAKHDAAGGLLWSASYDGGVNNNDAGLALVVDGAGNVYVAGRSASARMGSDGTDFDVLLVKYNADGTQAWVQTYDQAGGTDEAVDVAVSADGSTVYVAAVSENGTDADIVTLRYDAATGDLLQSRIYDSGAEDKPVGIGLGPGGEVYVGASSGNDFLLLKYAPGDLTSELWKERISGTAKAMAVDSTTDRIYLAGWQGRGTNFLTLAYDGNGTLLWQRDTSQGNGFQLARTVAVNGEVVAVAGRSGTTDAPDILIVTYDAVDGTLIWQQSYDSGAEDEAVAVAVDAAGNVYVLGHTGTTTARDLILLGYDNTGSLRSNLLHSYDGGGAEMASAIALGQDVLGQVTVHLAGGSDRPMPAVGSVDADYLLLKYGAMRADLVGDAIMAPAMIASESVVSVTPSVRNVLDSLTQKLADAGGFTVEIALATSTDPDLATFQVLGSFTVPGLSSGQVHSAATSVTIPPTTVLPEGNYFYALRIDTTDSVLEVDETNNIFFGPAVTVVDPPDLVPTAISVVDPATGNAPAASTITVEYEIQNIRSVATSDDFQVNFVFSSDDVIGNGDDLLLGSDTVSTNIAGNGSLLPTQAQVTIPNTTPAATYFLGIVVDANDDILEARDDNNMLASTGTFTVEPITDLTVTAVTGPVAAVVSNTIDVDYTLLANDVDASDIKVQLYLSPDAAITDADILLAVILGHNLTAGVPSSSTATVTVPSGTAQGVYYLGAIVNQNNANQNDAVSESNDNNNSVASVKTISIGLDATDPAALPDLMISDVSGPASAARGDIISVTTTVSNVLPKAVTSPFTVGIYLSPDATITTSDLRIGTRDIASLAGNTADTAVTDITVPFEQVADVIWADLTGLSVENGNNLRKTLTTNAWDAGSESAQTLDGDGYLEFTATATGDDRAIGLVLNNTGYHYLEMDYGIWLSTPDLAYAVESGSFEAFFNFTPGDVFRIERTGTTIRYLRYNSGTNAFDVIHTSNRSSSGSLRVITAFYDYNTTLNGIRIANALPAGSYYLGAIADIDEVITEVDENNNDAVQSDATGTPASTPIAVRTSSAVLGGGGGGVFAWLLLVLSAWLLGARRRCRQHPAC